MDFSSIKENIENTARHFFVSQCIYVVTKLNVANHLQHGAKNCQELAKITNSHADTLYRVMRTLANIGIFNEDLEQKFSLTSISMPLVENTIKNEILHILDPSSWNAWGQLLYSVKTGNAAFPYVFGMKAWEYRSQKPELNAIFNAMTTAQSEDESTTIINSFDFTKTKAVIDIGGGEGQLLSKILTHHSDIQGTLFEQLHVIDKAQPFLECVSHRCHFVAGNFLENVPVNGDVYILKAILHNWNDDNAKTILTNCRNAMLSHSKLLLIERILEEPISTSSHFVDLHMLVIHGSKERTRNEFSLLLKLSGFKIDKISKINQNLHLIESSPDLEN